MADFKIKKWSGSAWVDAHPETTVGQIVATGTPSSSTFLRGDGAWAVPSGVDNYVNITGDTMTGNLINQGYIEVEDPNDSDYVRYRHYGVEFNRSASYLRPETNGTYTLNIGSNDQNKPWDTIKLDADNKTIIPIGNVGIGTTNPKTKLNVASGTSAAVTPTLGSAENSSAIFTNSVNAYGLNVMPSGSGDVHLQVQRFDASTSVYDLNLQPSGGNVGIGTTSPAVKLDVNGDAILSGYLHATGNVVTNSNLYLNYDNSPAGVDSYVYFGDDASDTAHYLTFDNSAQFFTFSNAIYALGNVYADNNVYAKGNLLLNYDNTAADSSVYFGDAASDTAHYLTFDNSAQRFVISNTLLSYGNFITNGNIYLNNDNTAADSYVYFGDAASDTAHYLTFDNSAQRFVISNTLLSYGNFITNGNLYLNQDNTAGNSYVFFGDAASDNAHYLQFSDATQKFTLTDDLIVTGDVTVNGSFTMVDTNTSTTEQWSVTNDGTGPAVIINQTGSQPIMDVQDDGVSALYIADGGNVGIGDTTPTYKLEVAGDMAVNKIWDRNNGAYYLDPSLTSNLNAVDANLFEASSASSRDKFRVYPSSAYAIGMQSAVTYGGLNDWAMTFQFNDDNDRGFWWGDAAHSTAQGAMALTTRGELTVANRIRVGYGESDTTTPATYALDVSGNSYIDATGASATLTLGRYSGQPTIKAGTDDSGYLIMDSTGGKLGLNWYASDDVSIGLGGGNVGIGTSTPSDKLHIEGNQIISKATTGGQNQIRFQEAGTTKTQLTSNYGDNKFYLYHEGDNRMVIDSSGNTGIGTTSPSAKLDVAGSARFDGPVNVETNSTASRAFYVSRVGTTQALRFYTTDNISYIDTIQDENTGIYGSLAISADMEAPDSYISLTGNTIRLSGDVGIGTASPGVKLQVQANTSSPAMYIGNSNAGGYSSISFRNQANTSNIAHIGFGNASVGNTTLQNKAFFGTIGANDAVITTSDTVRMTVASGGNVGVGTTSPETKLKVLDTVNYASPTLGTNSGNFSVIKTDSAADQVGDYGLLMGISGSGWSWLQAQRVDGTATAYALNLQPSGGNVGIGTASPARKLDVAGDMAITSTFPRIFLVDTDTNSDFSIINSNGKFSVYDDTNGAYRLAIDSSGNVGIGTSTPVVKLDVNGDAKISGYLHATGNLVTNSNVYLNYDNSPAGADSYVYFGDDASDTAHYLTFDNSAQRFVISNTLLSYGNFITNGNIYLNNDNTAADSYVYFGDAASDTAHYLRFTNASQQFTFSNRVVGTAGRLGAIEYNGSDVDKVNFALSGSTLTITTS